jgi:hypothetical protein
MCELALQARIVRGGIVSLPIVLTTRRDGDFESRQCRIETFVRIIAF